MAIVRFGYPERIILYQNHTHTPHNETCNLAILEKKALKGAFFSKLYIGVLSFGRSHIYFPKLKTKTNTFFLPNFGYLLLI